MTYSRRMLLAAVGSLLAHAALLAFGGWPPPDDLVAAAKADPLVLKFAPPEDPAPARRLVESGAPGQTPDVATDLISDVDSRAQDLEDEEGLEPQPFFAEPADFDELGQSEETPLPEPAEPLAQPVPDTPREATNAVLAVETPETVKAPAEENPVEMPLVPSSETGYSEPAMEPETPQTVDEAPLEPIEPTAEPASPPQPAPREAPARPSAEEERTGPSRGRLAGGVKAGGLASFEAHQHALGAYMLEVRRRVERAWRTALALRYSGSTPTAAFLDIAIAPDGRLARLQVVEPGASATYATICREALKTAAPFPPFPFEVPSIFRSKNLEIRWKFSFM